MSDEDSVSEMEVDDAHSEHTESSEQKVKRKVYLPELGLKDNEELEHDPSAYVMLHQIHTEWPCMSFDIIPDNLGENRKEYPHTMYLVAGTQAMRHKDNKVLIMKLSNLCKTYKEEDDEESSDSSSSCNSDGVVVNPKRPLMSVASISHFGCVNRIRSTLCNGTVLAAVWSERRTVSIYDLKECIKYVDDQSKTNNKKRKLPCPFEIEKPLFQFTGHISQGFALDWSPIVSGVLATGDNSNNIHVWTPHESTWNVDLRPFRSHTSSVEDIQWSPKENSLFASCSADRSIKIWDIRLPPSKACMMSVEAHEKDVNVIHWNRMEPLILSGGDDETVRVWDLRNFKDDGALAVFKYHTDAITSVEWHPTDNTVFASSQDSGVNLWDLAVERDDDNSEDEIKEVPPQLLFMHLGQKEIKEVHWHPQIPGVLVSTSSENFNVFQTISV